MITIARRLPQVIVIHLFPARVLETLDSQADRTESTVALGSGKFQLPARGVFSGTVSRSARPALEMGKTEKS
jgi:hypothetical protein